MPIPVKCKCGKQFAAPEKFAGKKVKCPECSSQLVIPTATEPSAKPGSAPSSKLAVKCSCGKAFAAKPELAGKKVRCPSCKEPVKIPSSEPKSATPEQAKAKSSDDLFDELEIGFRGGGGRRCPECKRSMPETAIVCIECGYNENLGRRMKVDRPITKEDRDRRAAAKSDGPPKGKKKKWFF